MTTLLVVGTGPGAGATVATAALAAVAVAADRRCTVLLPAQTGVADGAPGDLAVVGRLVPQAGLLELARYPDPLPPAAAARTSGRAALDPSRCVQAVLDGGREADLLLVLAPHGLLARHDEDGFTMAALARTLRLPVVVVADVGPTGVHAAALTLEVAAARGLDLLGVVVGAWPAVPGSAATTAVDDLEMLGARPLLGSLPDDVRGAAPQAFLACATAGLGPSLGGTFDASSFRRAAR